jgi:hypothetical protein
MMIIDEMTPRGPYKIIHIRENTNGSFHRRTIAPDADYSNEPAEVKAVCDEVFTDAIKTAYANRPTI